MLYVCVQITSFRYNLEITAWIVPTMLKFPTLQRWHRYRHAPNSSRKTHTKRDGTTRPLTSSYTQLMGLVSFLRPSQTSCLLVRVPPVSSKYKFVYRQVSVESSGLNSTAIFKTRGINVIGTPCKIFLFNKLLALVDGARTMKILYTLFDHKVIHFGYVRL